MLQPLRPGRYDVLVKMRDLKAPMASVMDVVVQPGINKEPCMQPLDMRQSLLRYYLRACDESGQAFALDGPIHARFQQPDGSFVLTADLVRLLAILLICIFDHIKVGSASPQLSNVRCEVRSQLV